MRNLTRLEASLSVSLVLFALNSVRAAAPASNSDVPTPEMIGEGIISTSDDELGGGLAPDGRTFVFEKSAAPHYLYILCESLFTNGTWSKPGFCRSQAGTATRIRSWRRTATRSCLLRIGLYEGTTCTAGRSGEPLDHNIADGRSRASSPER